MRGFIGISKDNDQWQVLIRNVFTKKTWIFIPLVSLIALAVVEFFQKKKYRVSQTSDLDYLNLLLSCNYFKDKGSIDLFKPNGFWIVMINFYKRYKHITLSPLVAIQAIALVVFFQTRGSKVVESEETDNYLELLLLVGEV